MHRLLAPALAALLLLAAGHDATAQGSAPPICTSWVQVSAGAFGLDAYPPYDNEEGFEVLVYADQLYVGMEADNALGARLWRTRDGVTAAGSQGEWEEVSADAQGYPFGNLPVIQNDHIDSLAEFDGHLFASTANGGDSTYGTQVWRSPSGDPGAWVQVNTDGFGDVQNTNFKDMQVFDGWLCGGTQNWDWDNRDQPATWNPGAEVWCTLDGSAWAPKNIRGFRAGANIEVWSGHVHEGGLYFGVQNYGASRDDAGDDVATLFRTASLGGTPVWTEVLHGPPGSRRTDILGEMGGYLYVSHRSPGGIVILRSASGDPGTWTQVTTAGMDGNPGNISALVDSGTVYDGGVYVGIANLETGFEVWRTTGVIQADGKTDWVQVSTSGLGDPDNLYTELIPFYDQLYAWTSNYISGQQVRRTDCVVPGAGTDPPVAPVLSARSSANDIRLTWTHTTGNDIYEVWRSPQPYAGPGGSGADEIVEVLAPQTAPTVLFQDAGATAATSAAYYTIRARNGAGDLSDGSNSSGFFTYALVPGS